MDEYLPVEVALLLSVEDDEVQAVLEALECSADGNFRIHVARRRTPSGIDLSLFRTHRDLALGQHTHETSRAFSLIERANFGADDACDELTERQAAVG